MSTTRSDRWLARLSRRTTSGVVIREVDGVRFVAIALVVLFHLGHYTAKLYASSPRAPLIATLEGSAAYRLMSVGWFGVQIFFVVSGFVLALPWIAHESEGAPKPAIGRYYLRRLTRLEPPYLVSLTIMFILMAAIGVQTFGELAPHFAASSVYLHAPFYAPTFSPINGVIWTLEVEVQFYLVFPLLAQIFRIRSPWTRRSILLFGVVLGIAARLLIRGGVMSLMLPNFIQFFLLGMLIADVWIRDWKRSPRRSILGDLVWLVGWLGLIFLVPRLGSDAVWLTPWIAAILFIGPFIGRSAGRALSNRWISTIGGMCYSIYLVHMFVMRPLQSWLTALPLRGGAGIISDSFVLNLVVQAMLVLPQIALISLLFYVWVERPCMDPDWLKKLAARLSDLAKPRTPSMSPRK